MTDDTESADSIGRLLLALGDELESLRRLYEKEADVVSPLLAELGVGHSREVAQALQQHDLIVQEIDAIAAILLRLGGADGVDVALTPEDRRRLVDAVLSPVKLGQMKARLVDHISGKRSAVATGGDGDEIWD